MIDLDFPWWFVALAYLCAFGPWTCLGAAIGFVLAHAPLSASAQRGGSALGRVAIVGLAFLAALVGGTAAFLLALSAYSGG